MIDFLYQSPLSLFLKYLYQVILLLLSLLWEIMDSCLLYINLIGPYSAPKCPEKYVADINKSSVLTLYRSISPLIIYELQMNDGSRDIFFLILKVCSILSINWCFLIIKEISSLFIKIFSLYYYGKFRNLLSIALKLTLSSCKNNWWNISKVLALEYSLV